VDHAPEEAGAGPRRNFLTWGLMTAGLLASFGAAAGFAARYIYPRRALRRMREIFLTPLRDVPTGKGKVYDLPGGGTALVTHTGTEVVALSNVCPHLGCKVHWEEDNRRFFCPCHNGVFDPSGKALSGPPADEGKNLERYAVKQVGDNLFIEIEEVIEL
jgi:cytochrome b6-f complex iron-sulfur subunit